MNVVDSCGWLEYFAGGPNADFFAEPLGVAAELVVPSVSMYEVYKCVAKQRGEAKAAQAVVLMQQGSIAALTAPVAVSAARISLDLGLPMADSVMLATARAHDAVLWTQDADFSDVPEVRYVEKGARSRP